MTREFDKQRGNDSRPSFRNKPAYRNGDERSPRPSRPRLNRETVDRAWESGAHHAHADYRPRGNNGPRNNWRNQQPSGYSSSQNGHGGNRPYNNQRQEHYRDNPRRFESDENNAPRSRSFNSNHTGRRDYNDQRSGERRDYRERSNNYERGPGYRDNRNDRNNRDNGQAREYGGQFRGRNQDRDYRRRDFEREERGGQSFGRRPFESGRRDDRGYQDRRSEPDTRNARSRPWGQRQGSDRPSRPYRPAYNERFEGDYERFDERDETPGRRFDTLRPERQQSRAPRERQRYTDDGRDNRQHAEERHVTRLPDGRVLKGPRPVQRKEARFWADISENTDDLVGHIPTPESTDAEASTDETQDSKQSARPRKSRTRSASASVRAKKATGGGSRPGPKPSQRGFKWPTP